MRNKLIFFSFMFFSLLVKGQNIIPGASIQPAWVFPIYFEDGIGAKDTLYAGFDSSANWISFSPEDSIYGVKKIKVDTNQFFAQWGTALNCGSSFCDSVYKVNVTSFLGCCQQFPDQKEIVFANGIFPLKMSWDISAMHSDSLPFPHNNNLPVGQAKLLFNYSYTYAQENGIILCGASNGEILITDSLEGANCRAKDSTTFVRYNMSFPQSIDGPLIFWIEQWSGVWVSITEKTDLNLPLIFPNPADNFFNIPKAFDKRIEIKLFDISGRLLIFKTLDNNPCIDTHEIEPGTYFVQVNEKNNISTYKLVITHH